MHTEKPKEIKYKGEDGIRRSEIRDVVGELSGVISVLYSQISELEEKLDSVTSKIEVEIGVGVEKEKDTPEDPNYSAPLAKIIDGIVLSLRSLSNKIDFLTSRIEL